MKKIAQSLFSLIIFAAFFGAIFTSSALAQTQEDVRMQYVMNQNTDPEEFRREMNDYLSEMENVLKLYERFPAARAEFEKSVSNPSAALREAKAALLQLSAEDLIKMRAVYAKFPGWREAPRTIHRIIAPKIEAREKRLLAGKDSGGSSDNVIIPDGCPTIDETPSFADIAVTEGALHLADGIMEGFPTDAITIAARLVSIGVRAGIKAGLTTAQTLRSQYDDCNSLSSENVQTIVTNAKTEIINNNNSNTDVILANSNQNTTTITSAVTNAKTEIINNNTTNTTTITQSITDAQTSINNTAGSNTTTITNAVTDAKNTIVNNDNSNRTQIITNDNQNALTINTNIANSKNEIISNATANKTEIINNSNANTVQLTNTVNNAKTEIINNATANKNELRDLLLRSQIEADLATESNGVKVAWYMTPTANGGHLDFVQRIVTETLANIRAAGGSVGNAQSFLDRANADKAAGNFKSAYDNYRKAYKAAAN